MKIDLFINRMRFLKQLRESKEDIEREIDEIIYRYMGVKGVSFEDKTGTTNPQAKKETFYKMAEELDYPQIQLERTIHQIELIEPIVYQDLNRLPSEVKLACEWLFWDNMTYGQVGRLLGYSDNGIWHMVRREINKL